jgi:hypothetical protein
LGAVPSEPRIQNLTEEQWLILGQHHINRRDMLVETVMDLVEYMAILVTPHPKEAMKVIEGRKKEMLKRKVQKGDIDGDKVEKKLFTDDHRSTSFYEELAKHGGERSAEEAAAIFNDDLKGIKTQEVRDMDIDDYEFIQKIKKQKEELDQKAKQEEKLKSSFDTIEF